ncbi:asparagine synthase, partial [bacterium]|nr:asparagine synthase [bacterium]
DYLMEKAVKARMEDKDKIGIFLSGGLDSRLIAAFAKRIADHTNKELISFTFGTKGGWQEKIAKQVAEKLEIENRFFEVPSDSIAKYAEEIVYKGDGQIRIRDAHFISGLDKVKKEVDTVLVGFFCSELFGDLLSEDVLNIFSKEEFLNYLFDSYKIAQNTKHLPEIFSEFFLTDFENFERKVRENFSDIINLSLKSYADVADYWELRQRDRRYILPLSNYMGWYLDARLPYLDNKVVDFAVNLPLDLRFKKRFIHKALKSLFPDLAKIHYEDTGALPDTTGLPLLFSSMKRFAYRQLKRRIERASLGKILFIPEDYRAYNYWLRTGSKRYVEEVLLQGLCEDVFSREYVIKILKEHMQCKKNHDQLICDMLNLQLLLNKYQMEL